MKVVVVGSGVVGACSAYYLSRRDDLDVILIDKALEGRATSAGAGIISPWTSTNENEAWFQIATEGAAYYPDLIQSLEDIGETATGYKQTGALATSKDKTVIQRLRDKLLEKKERFPMIGEVNVLDAPEAQSYFPALQEELHAVYLSGAARLDGNWLRDALVRGVKKNNGTVIEEEVSLKQKGNKVIVSTKKKEIEADRVILAAGAWTKELMEQIGISINLTPQRGQIVHLAIDQDTSNWPVVLPQESSHYIVPFDDNRVVFGATREDETGYDYRLTAGGVQEVLDEGLKVAPGLTNQTLKEVRIGFRPMSPDNLPLLGSIPALENLVVATGLGASGLTMGPYVGKLAAKIALNEEVDIDLAAYNPLRS
jgi:D-amino-acid dehydrogenase